MLPYVPRRSYALQHNSYDTTLNPYSHIVIVCLRMRIFCPKYTAAEWPFSQVSAPRTRAGDDLWDRCTCDRPAIPVCFASVASLGSPASYLTPFMAPQTAILTMQVWGCNSVISDADRASGGQLWGGIPYPASSTSGAPPASTATAQQWILRYSCAALLQWVALSRVAVSLTLGLCEPSGISLDNFTAYSAGFVALGVSQSYLVPRALTAVS